MAIALTAFLTLTPTRATDDANNERQPIAPIDCVPVLNEPQPVLSERSKRFVQTGDLYVRKGADLEDGDEITLPEGVFGVVGGPRFNQLHPMTKHDFGWVVYSIRKGG
ncbi:hypothetical protein OS122_02530 [Mycolicibacterium mucogenicum]|uniref:hypothetical protein n=1 Tax=Mycolicibacterium mucogenicum TaxID=56689 RepID=UPI00226A541E|nr:hypothetical protein [Mycolicibacterium mucogenicum]MCX8559775.1 hypothetical protein [Mycolicibacterium mucogenicum]